MATRSLAAPNHAERTRRILLTLRKVMASAKRHLVEVRDKCELSGAQLWALSQIGNQPGMTVQELATAMSVHQSTASNLVEKLVKGRLVRRKRGATDRRQVLLHATPSGSALLRKAPATASGALPAAMSRMTDEELQALEASLLVLADKLGTLTTLDDEMEGLPRR